MAAPNANYDYMWEEYKKALDKQKAQENESIDIYPEPGFVVKIQCQVDGYDKDVLLVLNMCQSPYVGAPSEAPDPSGGPARVRLPLSCGPIREEKDKSGAQCAVFDVVFNPEVMERSAQDSDFKETVSQFALQNIQRKFKVQPISKLKYPKIRYMGTRPPKQRIRKSGVAPKVQELSSENPGVTGTNGQATKNKPVDNSGLFKAKIPDHILKPKEPPMTKEEAVLMKEFRKQMPDLKRSELHTAIKFLDQKQKIAKAESDKLAKEKEAKAKISEFETPQSSIYCRTHKGSKVTLAKFLGQMCVRAPFEDFDGDDQKQPLELVIYVKLPKLTDLSDASLSTSMSANNLLLVETEAKQDADSPPPPRTRGRYRLNMALPFTVDPSSSVARLDSAKRRVSVRVAVVQASQASELDWRKKLKFQNPFVFQFVS